MARTTYTEADRIRALAALAANAGNIKRTADEEGIPRGTLRRWHEQSAPVAQGVAQEVAQVIATKPTEVQELADREIEVRRQYLASSEAVVREAGRIAFADIRNVVTWDGETITLRPSSDLTPDQAAAIREVKATRTIRRDKDGGETITEVREVKLYDKIGALNLLSRRHAEFSEKHEFKGDLEVKVQALSAVAQMTPEQLREIARGR